MRVYSLLGSVAMLLILKNFMCEAFIIRKKADLILVLVLLEGALPYHFF